VFDLGLRKNLERYSEPIQQHAATRTPISTSPDVVKSLAVGGLTPNDIDFVVYSHVRGLELSMSIYQLEAYDFRYIGTTSASPKISIIAHS
jgi:hypothetical protein